MLIMYCLSALLPPSINRQWVLHDAFYYVSRVEMTDILTYSFNRFTTTFGNRKLFEFTIFSSPVRELFLRFPFFMVLWKMKIKKK